MFNASFNAISHTRSFIFDIGLIKDDIMKSSEIIHEEDCDDVFIACIIMRAVELVTPMGSIYYEGLELKPDTWRDDLYMFDYEIGLAKYVLETFKDKIDQVVNQLFFRNGNYDIHQISMAGNLLYIQLTLSDIYYNQQ